jgi:hypothetical protein
LGRLLGSRDTQAEVLYEPAWRATKSNIERMFNEMQKKLQEGHVDILIFCVMDNSVYFGLDEAGNTAPPQKDN